MRALEWRGRVAAVAGALALLGFTAATPMAAQQAERECRCVDASGNEIERCTCIRMPSFEGLPGIYGMWTPARARIGVSVDPEQDASLDAQGARVRDVMDDGPAARAGVREGDVITSLDGHDLSRPLEEEVEEDFDLDASIPVQRLLAIARRLEPDTEVEVELVRDGQSRVVTVETEEASTARGFAYVEPMRTRAFERRMEDMGERLSELGRREGLIARGWAPEGGALVFSTGERFNRCPGGDGEHRIWVMGDRCIGGLELVAVNPELGGYFGATTGVLVTAVHEDSPIGLEPGDVVLAVGDRDVESPERMRRILSSYDPEEAVTFRIVRNRSEMSVSGRLTPQ